MPNVNFNRYTYLLASSPALYPSEDLYPEESLYPADGTLVDVPFDKFDSGSLSVSEMIVDDIIQFGMPIANKFECRMYEDVAIDNAYIQVFQTIDNVDVPIFCGKVDSAKFDKSGTFKDVVAYDKFYELSTINVADWWETFWSTHYVEDVQTHERTYQATLKQVRDDFVQYFGLEEDQTYTLVNDSVYVGKAVNLSHMAFKDMLKAICELSGVFPNIGRDGKLQYISLNPSQTPHDMTGLYEADSSDFENYNAKYISGIHFLDSAGSSKLLVGTDLNCYTIESNVFVFSMGTSALQTLGTNLLNAVKDITFVPSNVNKIISDWDYKLGDKVATDRATFYIFENNYSGPQLVDQNIVCNGDEMLPQVEHSANLNFEVINENIGKLEVDISGLRTQFVTYQDTTNARFQRDESTLEQTSKSIIANVTSTQTLWVEEHPRGTALTIKYRGYENPVSMVEKAPVDKLPDYYPDCAVGDLYLNVTTGYVYELMAIQYIEEDTGREWYDLIWAQQYQLTSVKEATSSEIVQTAESITSTVAKEQTIWIEEHPIGTPITIKFKQYGAPKASVYSADLSTVYPNWAVNDLYLNMTTGEVYKLVSVIGDETTGLATINWTYQYTLDEEIERVYSQIEQTAESITSTVAGLQAIWDVGDRTVDWKDYGKPDTIQVPLDETGPSVGDYYLDVELGRLYTFTSVSQKASEDFDMYDYYDVTYSSLYTQLTTIKSSVESEIQQLADSITLSVSGAVGQQASIVLRVKGEVQSSGTIDLTGAVSFYDLSTSGRTTINGANITTGTIRAITINGCTISGNSITGGTISGATITSGNGIAQGNYTEISSGNLLSSKITLRGNPNPLIFGYSGMYYVNSSGSNAGSIIFGGTSGATAECSGSFYANGRVSGASLRVTNVLTTSNNAPVSFTAGDTPGLLRQYTGSSIRYKHDFKTELNEEFDPHKLYSIRIFQYKYQTNYLEDKEDKFYDKDVVGFLAEDIYSKYKIAADYYYDKEKEKDVITGWAPQMIIPPMLKLIQEQHKEIETLKAQMQTLLGGNEK